MRTHETKGVDTVLSRPGVLDSDAAMESPLSISTASWSFLAAWKSGDTTLSYSLTVHKGLCHKYEKTGLVQIPPPPGGELKHARHPFAPMENEFEQGSQWK